MTIPLTINTISLLNISYCIRGEFQHYRAICHVFALSDRIEQSGTPVVGVTVALPYLAQFVFSVYLDSMSSLSAACRAIEIAKALYINLNNIASE